MKKSIGILYICTGPYALFWEDFYNTFNEKFLPGVDKYYYVFTDADSIYAEEQDNVKKYFVKNLPWPLITLFRFDTFLSIKEELSKRDYLMFSNANIICNEVVTAEEFLPCEEKGEQIFVTEHPGYYKKHPIHVPYDRNRKCLAYIPWNCGKTYVIGAMFGGTSKAFLEMSEILKKRIEEDLKKNVIAQWHDESHLNRYIVGRDDCKYLSPAYCYPFGIEVPCPKKISAVSKQAKFDVQTFKGHYKETETGLITILKKIKRRIKLGRYLLWLRDCLLFRKVNRI